MKKFRGERRYYKKLEKFVDYFKLDFDSWYDFWHFHIDLIGVSNRGIKHRRRHLIILMKIFEKILDSVQNYSVPYQTWVYINKNDGSLDAIYFHTPNPNNDYPARFENIKWNERIPQWIIEILDMEFYQVGYITFNSEEAYIIRSVKYGEQF